MERRLIRFENTEHLKDYPNYGADTEGNIWSFKNKKPKILSPGWKKKNCDYKSVILTDKYNIKRSLLVHRLVALAFIPTNDITMKIKHRNQDNSDNRLENLEWISKKHIIDNSKRNAFEIDELMIDKIKEVHSASIRKGVTTVPNYYEFINGLIDKALDQYINQYGLRKVMKS